MRNGYRAGGFQIVGSASEVAEQLHLLEPSAQKAVLELTSGVEGVLKAKFSWTSASPASIIPVVISEQSAANSILVPIVGPK